MERKLQLPGNFQKPSLSFVCDQDWNNMQPCGQGRFCGSCRKTVVDFTQKSAADVQEMLAKREGEVCGRFYAHQLAGPVRKNGFSIREIFASFLVLLGLSFLSKEADAQQKKVKEHQNQKSDATSRKPKSYGENQTLTGAVAVDDSYLKTDVLTYAEVNPEFKHGGQAGLQKFLAENRKPLKDKTEGMVITSFVVDTLGQVSDVQILKQLSDEANLEAIRLTNLLVFDPGRQNGRKVKVRYTLPIRFKINKTTFPICNN